MEVFILEHKYFPDMFSAALHFSKVLMLTDYGYKSTVTQVVMPHTPHNKVSEMICFSLYFIRYSS